MIINNFQHITEKFEGFRQYPYRDTVGKLTVGYGFNLDDAGLGKGESKAILSRRLSQIHKQLNEELSFYESLSDLRKYVLVDMCYNMGFAGLMKFKKMLAALRGGEYTEAARQMKDSRWHEQVGRRAEILEYAMEFNTLTPFDL